jgi:hypothetical protein
MKSFRLEANLPTASTNTWFSSFDFGINYSDREKQKTQPEGSINLGPQGITAIGSEFQLGFVDLGFAGIGDIPAWDVPGAVDAYMIFNPNSDASYLVSKEWTVDEQITSAWFKANIDTTWGDTPVRGNIGIQAQHVDQSSDSFYWDSSQSPGQQQAAGLRRQVLHRLAAEPEPGLLADRTGRACASPPPARSRARAWTSCAPRWNSASATSPSIRVAAAATRCSIRGAPMPSTCPMNTTSAAARATSRRPSSTRT